MHQQGYKFESSELRPTTPVQELWAFGYQPNSVSHVSQIVHLTQLQQGSQYGICNLPLGELLQSQGGNTSHTTWAMCTIWMLKSDVEASYICVYIYIYYAHSSPILYVHFFVISCASHFQYIYIYIHIELATSFSSQAAQQDHAMMINLASAALS